MIRTRLLLLLCVLPCLWGCTRRLPGSSTSTGNVNTAAFRLNNLGVAEMNRSRPAEALALFRQAFRTDPSLFEARLNEGIALLNTQAFDEGREVLLDATRRQPDSARAWYNLGILYRNTAEMDPAIDAFERVTRLDPADADSFYFLGQLHAGAGRYDQAVLWYQRCLALDSLHLSAEFGLARAFQLSGNATATAEHMNRFDELTKSGAGKPISLVYGEQGAYSTAEPVAGADLAPEVFAVSFTPVIDLGGIRFSPRPSSSAASTVASVAGPGACFTDYDGDERFDLILPGDSRGISLFRNGGGGRFTDVTGSSGLETPGEALSCTVGDYDNDGLPDVFIGFQNRVAVYKNAGGGSFRDVSTDTGIRVDGFPLGIVLVDYDHDGDVDLYVSRFTDLPVGNDGTFNLPLALTSRGNLLWRNNGDGTFTDGTAAAGLRGNAPGIAALTSDFNNDRAIDFFLTGLRLSPEVFANSREGMFRPLDVWKSAFPAPPAGGVAFDFDKDGWMDMAFTHWGQPGLSVWKNLGGSAGFDRVSIPDPQWSRGWGLTAIDVDNDGWIDLAAAGEREGTGELFLLRNTGGGRFSDVTETAALSAIPVVRPRALVSADIDGDGDNDLLITQNGGTPVLLRNEGGQRNRSVRLTLQGLNDNKSGIGTKVEVFAGALRQKWEMPSASGYLGQGAPEILAGIGDEREADIVRLLWPTGVPQDEVQLPAGNRHVLKELDRRGSSCPVVFVWDGERYQFVSDIIGPGIVGEWVGPGERNVPDPNEYLKVDGSMVKPKNGRLSFRFAEVMEEITYLDHVRLLAVDHPSEVTVNPNEYFASLPPLPEFKVVTSRDMRPPRAALDDKGRNVLEALLQRDRSYVTGFESLPYPGYAKLHYLELDLGSVDSNAPLRLIMHGFIDYFTVTSIFAAYQGGVQPVAPFLEIPDGNGQWKRISDDIGFPAGLARTMVADLSGRLPEGTSRIRIGTNLKIYWDQILIDTTPQDAPFEMHEAPLAEAVSSFRGYPRRIEGSVPGDVTYIHEDVSLSGPYAQASGYYTAYGDVRQLLEQRDDRYVILGSGDEVALEFDSTGLPAVRPGWSRDYFLYADGFAKDMDFYSAYSSTVEPLPFHAMGQYSYEHPITFPSNPEHLTYRLQTNTRYVGGKSSASYRYQYPAAPATLRKTLGR